MIQQVVLPLYLDALEGARVVEKCPFDAEILDITIHFPDDCVDPATGVMLLEAAFGAGTLKITPRTGYIAINNSTLKFEFKKPIKVAARTEIWMEGNNHDGTSAHTLTAIVTIDNYDYNTSI